MLEGLAFILRRNLNAMENAAGQRSGRVRLTGGTTRIELLSRLKADALGVPVAVPDLPEAAAAGAALLAGVGCGIFTDLAEGLGSLKIREVIYSPDPDRTRWYDDMYEQVYRPLYENLAPVHRALERIQSGTRSPIEGKADPGEDED